MLLVSQAFVMRLPQARMLLEIFAYKYTEWKILIIPQ